MSATSYDKPTLFNDKGKPVVVSGWSTKYYCNVQDGRGVRCGPKDGPQCTSCVRLQVRMPPPYPQTKERIVPFWLKILEDWKKTGGRPCNEDGTPIFQQETKVSGLFMEHKIGLIKDLENLPESVIADRWAWTKTEKAWMVDIIRGLKIASSPTASPDKSSGSVPPASANESAELAVLRLELEDAKRKHKEDLQREQALRRTLEQEVARLNTQTKKGWLWQFVGTFSNNCPLSGTLIQKTTVFSDGKWREGTHDIYSDAWQHETVFDQKPKPE